jgi:hypothetical protein
MKINKYIVGLILSLLLLACAGTQWVKPGATQESFGRDRYACLQSSQQQVSGTRAQWDGECNCMRQMPFSEVQTNGTMFDACMNSKGYTLQRIKS